MTTKRKNMMEFLTDRVDTSSSLKDGMKRDLSIGQLVPRERQPRIEFDQAELETLASTIHELGIIQPIVVRPAEVDGTEIYEIVAGERRWRAAQIVGLNAVPVIVRYLDDKRTALYSLAENIARRNLNPIEQARGYTGVIDEHDLSQTELAEAIGQNVKTVNRVLRLLKLPEEIQQFISQDRLTAKHGEFLLGIPRSQQLGMAMQAMEKGWSVREMERQITRAAAKPQTKLKKTVDPDIEREQTLWSERLGADVKLNQRRTGKVSITITVQSLDEYQGVRDRFFSPDE
jgi:ParB family chromosome partitioning protein